jgi:hypothetical protein
MAPERMAVVDSAFLAGNGRGMPDPKIFPGL